LEELECPLVTSSYSKLLSYLTDRASTLSSRATAAVVVGGVALSVAVAGAAGASAASPGSSAAAAQSRTGDYSAGAPGLATAGNVISLAEKQVGITADASGETKFQQWYASSPDAVNTARRDGGSAKDYIGAEWCDMFVSWVGAHAGVKGMGRDAYTVDHAKWFEKTGRWGETPRPGAVVFYSWNGGGTEGIDHVGLVVRVNGDGSITTVEGNTTGDAVAERVRSTDQVVGYGYPDYAS
jgi:hypothetical protein